MDISAMSLEGGSVEALAIPSRARRLGVQLRRALRSKPALFFDSTPRGGEGVFILLVLFYIPAPTSTQGVVLESESVHHVS